MEDSPLVQFRERTVQLCGVVVLMTARCHECLEEAEATALWGIAVLTYRIPRSSHCSASGGELWPWLGTNLVSVIEVEVRRQRRSLRRRLLWRTPKSIAGRYYPISCCLATQR